MAADALADHFSIIEINKIPEIKKYFFILRYFNLIIWIVYTEN